MCVWQTYKEGHLWDHSFSFFKTILVWMIRMGPFSNIKKVFGIMYKKASFVAALFAVELKQICSRDKDKSPSTCPYVCRVKTLFLV